MAPLLRQIVLLALGSSVVAGAPPDPEAATADAIMAKVAAHTSAATEARRQYLYQQKVRASMSQTDGELLRRENREYRVVPEESTTVKTLLSLTGEYRDGKRLVPYGQSDRSDKRDHADRDTIQPLVDALVNVKDSRDGIPHTLFPLRSDDVAYYKFTLKGETTLLGRRAYHILFEPANTQDLCVHVGGDEGNTCHQWKGEAFIDVEEYQPVSIQTHLAKAIPWGVRVFMGIDVRQYGFSIDYQRVAENVWFPKSYGTEFRFTVFWGYKRTVTLSLENQDFRKTDASSTVHFDQPTN